MSKKAKIFIVIINGLGISIIIGLLIVKKQQVSMSAPQPNVSFEDNTIATNLTSDQEFQVQNQMAEIVAEKDEQRCGEISDEVYRKACVNNIALSLAQETGDIGQCQKVDGQLLTVADCEQQVVSLGVIEKNDPEICKKASNVELQEACLAEYLETMAIKGNNPADCQKLAGEQSQVNCKDRVLFENEFKNNREMDCSLFGGQEIKADCELFKANSKKPADLRAVCGSFKSTVFQKVCR